MTKTKIQNWISIRRLLAVTGLFLMIALSAVQVIDAQAVSQGYNSDTPIQSGMIVRLKEGDTTKVEPVRQEDADETQGVVVDFNSAPVTLSAEGQKVFVANTGRYAVLVSDQNGAIQAGDYLTVSSIAGVGMKVDDHQPIVVGRALEDFNGQGGIVAKATLGNNIVNIGRIMTDLTIVGNPLQKSPKVSLPGFLQRAAEAIAQKPVNATRAYLSLIVFFISTFVAGTLLYGGIKSAIISVGRNPLSRNSVLKGMLQVVAVGLTIFLVGIFGVYLLLRL
jgi:hypothetical protein